MPEPLKNYTQAAEWLGVPQKWLEAKVQAGEAPHTRLGKHVRFSQQHLDAIVAAGEPRSQATATTESSIRQMKVVGRRASRASQAV